MPSEIPTAIWSGTFKLMGVELKCHMLNDGQRVIEAESVNKFMEKLTDGELDLKDVKAMTDFFRWQRGD